MKILTVKKQQHKFQVFSKDSLYAEIIFDTNNIDASLLKEKEIWRIERDSNKNLVLKQNEHTLFTFKFDYVWGGAEIIASGIGTGYDITGRWFKPGTRLINAQDEDLIIAVKKGDGMEVTILNDDISAAMILATIYYHVYVSAGKMLSLIIGGGMR